MLKHLQARDDWNEKSFSAKGFTLIELLVVIVILGILAAVVVFAVSGIQDRGQKSACQTEARTVRTAQEARYAQGGTYTANLDNLVSSGFLSKSPTLVTATGTTGSTLTLQYTSTCTGAGASNP